MSDAPFVRRRNASFCACVSVIVHQPACCAGDAKGQYQGVIDCFVKTLRHDGLKAFYSGFVPNFARLGSWNVVMFLTLEQVGLCTRPPGARAARVVLVEDTLPSLQQLFCVSQHCYDNCTDPRLVLLWFRDSSTSVLALRCPALYPCLNMPLLSGGLGLVQVKKAMSPLALDKK